VILNFTINNILISSIIIKSIVELNSRVPNPSSKPRVEVSKPEPQSEPGAPSQSEDRGSTPQTPNVDWKIQRPSQSLAAKNTTTRILEKLIV
jgi:hypothetical protein